VDGLVFTPTKGQVPQGQTVTTGFIIIDANSLGFSATDDNTSVVATAVISENLGSGENGGSSPGNGNGPGTHHGSGAFDFLRNLSAATRDNDFRQAFADVSKDDLFDLKASLPTSGGTDNSARQFPLSCSGNWTAHEHSHFSLADVLAAHHAAM